MNTNKSKVSNQDYSDMLDALSASVRSAQSCRPEEQKDELQRVIRQRDRVIRNEPKTPYQALSDRAARSMASANQFVAGEFR